MLTSAYFATTVVYTQNRKIAYNYSLQILMINLTMNY